MDAEFWKDRWANNEIGFHRTEGNPLLLAYAPQLASYTRVYVPLCGKSLDMVHLQQRGHRVFGTELAETAVEQFYREQGVIPVVTITSKYGRYVGAGTETATAITLLLGNAFALDPADLDGPVDAVYDRASLVALDPATRTQFVASLQRVLRPQGALLLVAFEYEQTKIHGPPWSVSERDVQTLFRDFGTIKLLQTLNSSPTPRFREAGVTELVERAYWIEKR
jgi:thiopurine S-methyltransferase